MDLEFIKRRQVLADTLDEQGCSILILHYIHDKEFTEGIHFPHHLCRWLNLPLEEDFTFIMLNTRQIKLPEELMDKMDKSKPWSCILNFVEENPDDKVWREGSGIPYECTEEYYDVDLAIPSDQIKGLLQDLIIENRKEIFFYQFLSKNWEISCVEKLIRSLEPSILEPGKNLFSPEIIFDRLRLVKSPYEIDLIKKACEISQIAHLAVLERIKPGVSENVLDGIFTGTVICSGCRRTAYPNIIGSGSNSTIIHYNRNNRIMEFGDLLLIDAGAEWMGYASDVTRTYPVCGNFSKAQLDIYKLVLNVQLVCIANCKPNYDFNCLQTDAITLLTHGLRELGILKGSISLLLKEQVVLQFFPHGIGHWIGLQVHDCPSVTRLTEQVEKRTKFEPGMVITVEPGIYIGNHIKPNEFIDEKILNMYRGIGVRIEDVILIDTDNPKVLSQGIPKEVTEIEQFMNR